MADCINLYLIFISLNDNVNGGYILMVWLAVFIIIGFVLLIVLNNGLRLIGVF